MTNRTLSIVIPLLDEEESLRPLHAAIGAVLDREEYDAEIIFVDDGSTDGSFAVIRELAENDPRVKAIRFRRNFGKSAGLVAGFRAATGEIVITMDADLQDDPDEIPRLIATLDEGGRWVDSGRLSYHGSDDPTRRVIQCRTFVRNVHVLSSYLEASKQAHGAPVPAQDSIRP